MILGVGVMMLILVAIKIGIYSLMKFPIDTYIDTYTVVMALSLGLVLPQLSNLSPIRSLLASTLRDSLDLTRRASKPDEVSLTFTRLQDMGVSPIQLLVGLCFTIVGFCVYYFVPMALLLKKMNLFFFVLLCVLFGMVIGMLLIGSLLVPYLEQCILWILMVFTKEDRRNL